MVIMIGEPMHMILLFKISLAFANLKPKCLKASIVENARVLLVLDVCHPASAAPQDYEKHGHCSMSVDWSDL